MHFTVSDAEFDAIFSRSEDADLTYGSLPWPPADMQMRKVGV